MYDPETTKKLEGTIITLPEDYRERLLAITNDPRMRGFSQTVATNLQVYLERFHPGGRSLNVIELIGLMVAIQKEMMNHGYTADEVLTSMRLILWYLDTLITDRSISQLAIKYYGGLTIAEAKRTGLYKS